MDDGNRIPAPMDDSTGPTTHDPLQAALEAAEAQMADRVFFGPKQQEKINELIREAQGRAAREVRAEAARLKQELNNLRAQAPPSAEQAAELEARVTRAKSELTEVETATQTARREATLQDVATKAAFIDPAVGAELLRGHVAWVDGELRPVNQHGSPLLNGRGEAMTVEEYSRSIAEKNPYLIRGEVRGGIGSHESRQSAPTGPTLEEVFGPRSNGRLANELAMRSPKTYQQMRLKARQQGLIG